MDIRSTDYNGSHLSKLTQSMDDIIINTPSPPVKKRSKAHKCKAATTLCIEELELLNISKQTGNEIQSKDKFYIFLTVKEALGNNIKKSKNNMANIIGEFHMNSNGLAYLVYENFYLLIDNRLLRTLPKNNESVNMYGHLEYADKIKFKKPVPILVAHFWNIKIGNIKNNIRILMMQRNFMCLYNNHLIHIDFYNQCENNLLIKSYIGD